MEPGPKILLVEDEPILSELLTEALTDKGFAVHAAPNADGALKHLRSGADVDIMFTDIDLGAGMDGAQLACIARQMRPQLPIIYASGRRSLGEFRNGAGFDLSAQALHAEAGRRDDRAVPRRQARGLASYWTDSIHVSTVLVAPCCHQTSAMPLPSVSPIPIGCHPGGCKPSSTLPAQWLSCTFHRSTSSWPG